MEEFILSIIIGIVIIVIGICNMRGNISLLHSYHRKRVREEDRLPFGKKVGLGGIIVGCTIIINSLLSVIDFYVEEKLFVFSGNLILIIGFIVGFGIIFYAMFKYNKGLF